MDWTPDQLQRELDRIKSEIFLHRGEAHLAHILCSVNTVWAEDAVTAYTNGMIIAANPNFILPLKPKVRETVFAHELWHIAMLHLLRGQGKDWGLWNMATDYWINNMLHNKGYSFEGIKPWLDHRYDDMAVEEIYEDLLARREANTLDDPGALWGAKDDQGNYDLDDLKHPTQGNQESNIVPPIDQDLAQKMINAVVQATQYAAQVPGGDGSTEVMQDLVNQFLQPKIRWEKELLPFFTALEGKDFDWRIPSRRIRHTYMPALTNNNEGGLTHIAFFGDSSGSITKAQLVRINSEAHYIKKRFNPELFTMINFDDEIEMVFQMTRSDAFDEMKVVGRGGTNLAPVRQWIIDNKPKAVVIFSDMCCDPMEPLEPKDRVPILWIVFNNPGATVPHGKVVHISE